mmetsp:Transcript_19514/g.47121  ORF Transcript_19514/g.47121 Transcript_19514/m.47121 type:complete len:245 (-) Transcript_19514:128-862(-)
MVAVHIVRIKKRTQNHSQLSQRLGLGKSSVRKELRDSSSQCQLLAADSINHLVHLLLLRHSRRSLSLSPQICEESRSSCECSPLRPAIHKAGLREAVVSLRNYHTRRTLHYEEQHSGQHHDTRGVSDVRCASDPCGEEAPISRWSQLRPRIWRIFRLGVLRIAFGIQIHAATKHRQEPRKCEQHDGGSSHSTDSHSYLSLGVRPQPRKQHHHAVRNCTEHGQDDAAHKSCDTWHQQQQLTSVAD